MRNSYLRIFVWALPFTLLAPPASAQDERVRLAAGTAATTGAGDNVALTASVGYRFLERLAFEVDFTATESTGGDFVRPLATIRGFDGGAVRGGLITRGRPGVPGGPMDQMRGQSFDRIAIFPPVPRGSSFLVPRSCYQLPTTTYRLAPRLARGTKRPVRFLYA